jgi:hypothetical protein
MAMSKKDRAYLSRVAELGCVVCRNQGYGATPAEIHHIRSGQGVAMRASHTDVIPLCPIHHRYGAKSTEHGEQFGYHQSPGQFEDAYGTEVELLEQVKGELGV